EVQVDDPRVRRMLGIELAVDDAGDDLVRPRASERGAAVRVVGGDDLPAIHEAGLRGRRSGSDAAIRRAAAAVAAAAGSSAIHGAGAAAGIHGATSGAAAPVAARVVVVPARAHARER